MVAAIPPFLIQSSVSGSVSIAMTTLSVHVVAVEHTGDLFTQLRFEADQSVNHVLFFADDLCGGVESNARIALDIDLPRDLDVGRALESVLVAALTILHIGLGGHAENNDVAFALKILRQTLSANEATLVVVRANEKSRLQAGASESIVRTGYPLERPYQCRL
jgi:hypothetical protein